MKKVICLLILTILSCFMFAQIAPTHNYSKLKDMDSPELIMSKEEPFSIAKSTGNTASSNSNTTLISHLANGPCYAVDVVANIAYFGNGNYNGGYLEIVNISDPASPIQLSKIVMSSYVYGVAVSGIYAYIAGDVAGLRIIDISDPASPTEAGFFEGIVARGVAISGIYAYVVDYYWGLRIIDISTPATPTEVGFFDTGCNSYGLAVRYPYVYIAADGGSGLRIIDISIPASPTEAGFFVTGNAAIDVAVSGHYAYVANGDEGLRIIDIYNPASPTETGFFDTGGYALGVTISGSYAYVADYDDGLRIIDISDPASPTEAGFFDTGGNSWDVAVSGSYAYVADENDGLYIIRNDLIVSVDPIVADHFMLDQNFPNPFNPTTVISYQLSATANVELSIYDMSGKKVATLVNENMPAGYHETSWDASDFASGIYFYRLTAGDFIDTKKMVFMK